MLVNLSLSTIVLNSKDRYENAWLPDFCTSKNHPTTNCSRKKPTYMQWYCCNNAVPLLNEAKTLTFPSIPNFKNFEIYLNFVCQPASQPAVRPTSTRCTAPEIPHNKPIAADLRNCCSDEGLSTAPW